MSDDTYTTDQLSGMTREMLVQNLNMETAENYRLRTILLELASRPEITQDTRTWLATKIRERGKEPVVRGLREDEMDDVRTVVKWSRKLSEHVRRAVDADESRHPDRIWYQQADTYCNQVDGAVQELGLMRDLTDLEEAR